MMSCTVDSLQINGIYLCSSENCLVPVLRLLAAANFLSYARYPLLFLQLFLPLPSFCRDFFLSRPDTNLKNSNASFMSTERQPSQGDRKHKSIVGSASVVPTYSEHSAASHRATWANTICHVSEGRRGASPARQQGPHLANLQSQMRSRIGQNGRAKAVNQKSHI